MGWTIYNDAVNNPLAKCDSLCTWDNERSRAHVLTSAIVGTTYYAAVESLDKETGKSGIWAAVFLLQMRPFGYKDMSEDMGPNEDRAPRAVLEALAPLPVDETACTTCNGRGVLEGEQWAEHARGAECHVCKGKGTYDCHGYARDWRRRAWAHHVGHSFAGEFAARPSPAKHNAAEIMRLRLASPKRADAGRPIPPQHDAGALALFDHAQQPRLF